ncbi:hypothetical protein A4V15_18640 [Pseudomonas oryzihabitans]|uniref:Uncharacterized protein n=1 Tax=Pseudomonas oryzihabitans TaxID=47885 RepID=A0A178LHD2_9PSED|nr:hypothetical protein A4V15_18640 [Pseudomonas oryzihabitans]
MWEHNSVQVIASLLLLFPLEKGWDQIPTLKPAFQSNFVRVPTFPVDLRFQTRTRVFWHEVLDTPLFD